MISTGGLHIDTSLSNVSLMYRNGAFVADLVAPVLPVDKQSNKYWVYGTDNLRADDDTRRPGGLANEITWNLSANPYYCDGHALAQYIPDEWRENADAAIDLDVDVDIQLTDKILLNREINLYNAIVAALTAGAVDQVGAKWNVNTTDPVAILDQYKETVALAIGLKPNSLLLPRPVFRAIRNNSLVKARVSGANSLGDSLITQAQLATVLEIENLIVAEAIQVTSAEDITPVTSQYVWGTSALLFYKPPSPGLRTVSLAYQFTWNKGRLGSLVYKDRAQKRHADWMEVMRYYDERVVSANAGVLFLNCV